jgi:hypothetical protein
MSKISIYSFPEALLAFFVEIADRRTGDMKFKHFLSADGIEELVLVKLWFSLC